MTARPGNELAQGAAARRLWPEKKPAGDLDTLRQAAAQHGNPGGQPPGTAQGTDQSQIEAATEVSIDCIGYGP